MLDVDECVCVRVCVCVYQMSVVKCFNCQTIITGQMLTALRGKPTVINCLINLHIHMQHACILGIILKLFPIQTCLPLLQILLSHHLRQAQIYDCCILFNAP